MLRDDLTILREQGINPSAQRVAVASYVLHTDQHPTADEVWTRVRRRFPVVSRATIYNTLKLFVDKGLLRQFTLPGGKVVYDAHVADHHHFIDLDSGQVHDVPVEAVQVHTPDDLGGLEVEDLHVVMRGRRKVR
jgi:Fe2+ or Zn2+ uptake regulation protein